MASWRTDVADSGAYGWAVKPRYRSESGHRYAGCNWAPNYESGGETVDSSDVDRLRGLPGKLPRPEEKTQPGMLHCDGMGRLDGSTIGSGLQIGDDYFSRPAQTGIPQVR